jgi:hypothetical protein
MARTLGGCSSGGDSGREGAALPNSAGGTESSLPPAPQSSCGAALAGGSGLGGSGDGSRRGPALGRGGSEPQAQPSAPPASTPADSGAFMDLSAAWRAVRQDREHAPESPSSIKPLRSHDANPHLQCGCSRSGDGPGSVRRGATPTGHCHSPSSSRNRCRGIRAASPAGRESEILRRFVLPVE